ncbi:unnamed protein product [Owenia fusiformis]|uniref:Uncharacterized protein n=1 Tax=Owenia fusiformis TaxID=6347 RepID=A0A8J1V046_OWEFU|nr:unnamed protein product [Owenia fusiformis]
MADQQDPEDPDGPEHDLSEEDLMYVALREAAKEMEFARGVLFLIPFFLVLCLAKKDSDGGTQSKVSKGTSAKSDSKGNSSKGKQSGSSSGSSSSGHHHHHWYTGHNDDEHPIHYSLFQPYHRGYCPGVVVCTFDDGICGDYEVSSDWRRECNTINNVTDCHMAYKPTSVSSNSFVLPTIHNVQSNKILYVNFHFKSPEPNGLKLYSRDGNQTKTILWTNDHPIVEEKLQTVKLPYGAFDLVFEGGGSQSVQVDNVEIYCSYWTEWRKSECPVTCGGGVYTFTRKCTYEGRNKFLNCPGPNIMYEEGCGSDPCPVHGHWGKWENPSSCSESCGGGTRTRARVCNNPYPQHGGMDCVGISENVFPCNDFPCSAFDAHPGGVHEIFSEIQRALLADSGRDIELFDNTYKDLLDTASIKCNDGEIKFCHTRDLLAVVAMFRVAKQKTQADIRYVTASDFQSIGLQAYMSELKQRYLRHQQLFDVYRGMNIEMNQTTWEFTRLSTYFRTLADYERSINEKDKNRLSTALDTLRNSIDGLKTSTQTLLTAVQGTLTGFAMAGTAGLTAFDLILKADCLPRLGLPDFPVPVGGLPASDPCTKDIDRTIKRIREQSNKNKDKISKLGSAVSPFINEVGDLATLLNDNKDQIDEMKALVEAYTAADNTISYADILWKHHPPYSPFPDLNSSIVDNLKQDFVDKYGTYEPKVVGAQIAAVTVKLKDTASKMCELFSTGQVIAESITASKSGLRRWAETDCPDMLANITELDQALTTILDFQERKMEVMSRIVRSHLADVYGSFIGTSATQINLYPVTVLIALDSARMQRAAVYLCNAIEFKNGGARPDICRNYHFTMDEIDRLISMVIREEEETVYRAYIPTTPNGLYTSIDSYINLNKLLKGETILFRLPKDPDWLMHYRWIDNPDDLNDAMYIDSFQIVFPYMECQHEHLFIVKVDIETVKTVTLYPTSDSPCFQISPESYSFAYEGNYGWCPADQKMTYPDVCVRSGGILGTNDGGHGKFVLPTSYYSDFHITLNYDNVRDKFDGHEGHHSEFRPDYCRDGRCDGGRFDRFPDQNGNDYNTRLHNAENTEKRYSSYFDEYDHWNHGIHAKSQHHHHGSKSHQNSESKSDGDDRTPEASGKVDPENNKEHDWNFGYYNDYVKWNEPWVHSHHSSHSHGGHHHKSGSGHGSASESGHKGSSKAETFALHDSHDVHSDHSHKSNPGHSKHSHSSSSHHHHHSEHSSHEEHHNDPNYEKSYRLPRYHYDYDIYEKYGHLDHYFHQEDHEHKGNYGDYYGDTRNGENGYYAGHEDGRGQNNHDVRYFYNDDERIKYGNDIPRKDSHHHSEHYYWHPKHTSHSSSGSIDGSNSRVDKESGSKSSKKTLRNIGKRSAKNAKSGKSKARKKSKESKGSSHHSKEKNNKIRHPYDDYGYFRPDFNHYDMYKYRHYHGFHSCKDKILYEYRYNHVHQVPVLIKRTKYKKMDEVVNCWPNPCRNGGVCTEDANGPHTYSCSCPSGFYGNRCEQENGTTVEWKQIGVCSRTCDGGIQLYEKVCYGPDDKEFNCIKPRTKTDFCNTHQCPKPCHELVIPDNGQRLDDGCTAPGCIAKFSCNEGYMLQGSAQRECLYSGIWTGFHTYCIDAKHPICPVLYKPDGGHMTILHQHFGAHVHFGCGPFATLSGSVTRKCLHDGHWTGHEAVCTPDIVDDVWLDCNDTTECHEIEPCGYRELIWKSEDCYDSVSSESSKSSKESKSTKSSGGKSTSEGSKGTSAESKGTSTESKEDSAESKEAKGVESSQTSKESKGRRRRRSNGKTLEDSKEAKESKSSENNGGEASKSSKTSKSSKASKDSKASKSSKSSSHGSHSLPDQRRKFCRRNIPRQYVCRPEVCPDGWSELATEFNWRCPSGVQIFCQKDLARCNFNCTRGVGERHCHMHDSSSSSSKSSKSASSKSTESKDSASVEGKSDQSGADTDDDNSKASEESDGDGSKGGQINSQEVDTPDGERKVDGGWSVTQWSRCSVTCGSGSELGSRDCNSPKPAGGGALCDGPTIITRTCDAGACGGREFGLRNSGRSNLNTSKWMFITGYLLVLYLGYIVTYI